MSFGWAELCQWTDHSDSWVFTEHLDNCLDDSIRSVDIGLVARPLSGQTMLVHYQ